MAATKNTKAFYNTEIPSDWKESNINEMFYFKQGVQCAVDNQFDICNEGRVRFIRIIDLTDSNEPKRYIDDPGTEHHVLPDDLFMIRYGTPGVLGYGYKGVIANNLFRIIPKTKTINQFYYYQLTFKEIQIQKLASSSTMPALNFESLSQLKLLVPPLSEQKAIAQVLSTADAAIHTTEKLIDQKELRKKWLMQQLLTGKKRLKGFGGEWKSEILGNVVNLEHGYQFRDEDFVEEGIPVIKIRNVIGYDLVLTDMTFVDASRLEEFKSVVIENGDLLMSLTGNIGRVVEVKGIDKPMFQNYRVGKFTPIDKQITKAFLKFILSSDILFRQFNGLANQSAQANFGKQDMDKLKFRFPISIEEQTAIAQVLQAADTEISLLKAKAEKLREQKKGLMQQLLTGKKRIKV